jgi:hypothetical protein
MQSVWPTAWSGSLGFLRSKQTIEGLAPRIFALVARYLHCQSSKNKRLRWKSGNARISQGMLEACVEKKLKF